MTLAEKFTRLKTSVGGNREKMHFEDTFGMPKEEQAHITRPAARTQESLQSWNLPFIYPRQKTANTTLLWRKRWIICWKNSRPRAY